MLLPYILRKRKANSACIHGVGERTHRMESGCHELLGAAHSIPIGTDSLECIVCGNGIIVKLFNLLQHRIGLTCSKYIPGSRSTGSLLAVATPAAVIIFRAPGPIDVVHAKISFLFSSLHKILPPVLRPARS